MNKSEVVDLKKELIADILQMNLKLAQHHPNRTTKILRRMICEYGTLLMLKVRGSRLWLEFNAYHEKDEHFVVLGSKSCMCRGIVVRSSRAPYLQGASKKGLGKFFGDHHDGLAVRKNAICPAEQ